MQQMNTIANRSEPAARLVHANVGEVERAMSALAGAALLGLAWKRGSPRMALMSTGLVLRGVSGYCPAYAAIGVDRTDTKQALAGERGIHIREAITIDAPPEAVYRFWRQLERLPEIERLSARTDVHKIAETLEREMELPKRGASSVESDPKS